MIAGPHPVEASLFRRSAEFDQLGGWEFLRLDISGRNRSRSQAVWVILLRTN
jgi:hypothetical protein